MFAVCFDAVTADIGGGGEMDADSTEQQMAAFLHSKGTKMDCYNIVNRKHKTALN